MEFAERSKPQKHLNLCTQTHTRRLLNHLPYIEEKTSRKSIFWVDWYIMALGNMFAGIQGFIISICTYTQSIRKGMKVPNIASDYTDCRQKVTNDGRWYNFSISKALTSIWWTLSCALRYFHAHKSLRLDTAWNVLNLIISKSECNLNQFFIEQRYCFQSRWVICFLRDVRMWRLFMCLLACQLAESLINKICEILMRAMRSVKTWADLIYWRIVSIQQVHSSNFKA